MSTPSLVVLGIESTAHTIGVGIVRAEANGRCTVLANQRNMFMPAEGGIHPREAANHHVEHIVGLIQAAFDEAQVRPEAVEAIAFSQGPGLGPCLRTGATAARALSLRLDVPLVGVNHCVSHLEIGRGVTDAKDPLLLYASGGNTQIIAFAQGRYRVFGETLDVGVGNMLDKFARDQGMPFPGGPKLEKHAKEGTKLLDMPYPVKGMDTAFSGILTAANTHIKNGHALADVAYSIQETCFAALTEVTERALAQTGKTEVLMGGGVACNDRLAQMVETMARERGCRFYRPPKSLLVDNGAMIAWNGLLAHRAGATARLDQSQVSQRYRTDEVEAKWWT